MAKAENTAPTNSFYIQPQPGFVICKPYKEQQVSGIYISDSMKNKDSAGVVVAVGDSYTILEGPQSLTVNPPVKVGDKIIFTNFGDNKYLDFKTGEHIYIVHFSPDPRYNQIIAKINE